MGKTLTQIEKNRSLIIETIFRHAPISRVEISGLTGITPASVTAAVSDLIKENIVYEVSQACDPGSSAGRKPIPLDINENFAHVIGVEFTPKALVICLSNLKGQCDSSLTVPFRDIDPSRISEEITAGIRKLLGAPGVSYERLLGVGIAIPGHYDRETETMISNNRIWSSFNAAVIQKELNLPVYVENNVDCMAIGQYLFRPSQTPADFVYFHVGHGMYCSHVIHARIYEKNVFTLGEIGHTIVDINGPLCECGKHGCLQIYSSESWIIDRARLLYNNSPTTYLKTFVPDSSLLTMEHVLAAYTMGDSAIQSYITTAIKYLGMTISNLDILLGADKTFLHGLLFEHPQAQAELMNFIGQQLEFISTPYSNTHEIVACDLSDGAMGGCALAVFELFIKVHPFSK